jgi:hypothetical protein
MSAPQPIADWLEKLGLRQYAPRFTENDINVGILLHLTEQDLKERGVVSLGHRRQLLLAVAKLSGVQKGPAKPPTTEAPITPYGTAERRQVTSARILRGHLRLSEVRRRDRAALWRVRSEVHG